MARSPPLIRIALSLHDVFTEGTGVLVDSLSAWVVEARECAVLKEDNETGASHLLCRWDTLLRLSQDTHLIHLKVRGVGHLRAAALACVDDECHFCLNEQC